jgi:hypothetical protein
MKNYSRQLGKFIESKFYADSAYSDMDDRTWVSYYQDENGLIHSSTFNYSIIGCEPVTVEEFKKLVAKNPKANVIFA